MRRLLISLLLLCATSVTVKAQEKTTPARPASVDALIETATAAIVEKDVETFMALIPNVKEMGQYCPKMVGDNQKRQQMEAYFARFRKKIGEAIEDCHKTFDLKKAKRVRVEGGEKSTDPLTDCIGLFEVKDIKIYYELDGKHYRLKLDDPFVSKTGYGLLDDPRCTEEDLPPVMPTKPSLQ